MNTANPRVTNRADCSERRRPHWRQQLVQVERGLVSGVRNGSAFAIHFFGACAVTVAGFVFGLEAMQWSIVGVCLTVVLTAEMFYQAVKTLVTDEERPATQASRHARGIAQAAVILAVIGCGSVILLQFWLRLQTLLHG